MSIHTGDVRRVAAAAVGAGAIGCALLFGAADPVAQAAPAPAPAPQSTGVVLADVASPMAAPPAMPMGMGQVGAPDVLPMWWGHHHHFHHRHHGVFHFFNPWRWFWFW